MILVEIARVTTKSHSLSTYGFDYSSLYDRGLVDVR